MQVAQIVQKRRSQWKELEALCIQMQSRKIRRMSPVVLTRFASLYRAACADLALAEAYQLPQPTVIYLHQLVAEAHNQLYRTRRFNLQGWMHELFVQLPPRLFHDNCIRLAFLAFYGPFVLMIILCAADPEVAVRVVGKENLTAMVEMHQQSVGGRAGAESATMFGFYGSHNTTIGIRCFAFGLLFGVGGLVETLFNATFLGAVFGYMASLDNSGHFFEFVLAHGPFELTAIVLSAGAGMRLGFSLIHTKGRVRSESLRIAAREAMPAMGAAMILFFAAGLIEAFISPSALPRVLKAAIAATSAALLVFYFAVLGWQPIDQDEEEAAANAA